MNPKLQAFITKTGLAAHLPKDYATQFPYVVLAAGATELLGALLFIANFPVGACLLLTFLLVTSVIVHDVSLHMSWLISTCGIADVFADV